MTELPTATTPKATRTPTETAGCVTSSAERCSGERNAPLAAAPLDRLSVCMSIGAISRAERPQKRFRMSTVRSTRQTVSKPRKSESSPESSERTCSHVSSASA